MMAGEGSLCLDCQFQVQPVQLPFCSCCGDPVAGELPGEFLCAWCQKTHPAFDWARSAVRYTGPVRHCLHALKYHSGFWVLPDVERWLRALWNTCPPEAARAQAILPVPLHPRKARQRQFNQSALLAAAVSRLSGIPVRPFWLRRGRLTGTQTHLTAAQRARNVHGVFEVPWPALVRGRRLLLVDDVMTTGATLNECAKVLRAAGAESVGALTVARG